MRLLLVEDNVELQTRLREQLTARGYAVDCAGDGIDAEYLGANTDYDLIILDLGLPGRTGLDVLANWRTAGITTPVLILTARDAWHERVDGLKHGADDYLGKPFHFEELALRLQAIRRRTERSAPNEIASAGMTLDEDRQAVMRGSGEPIALTGTEFRLLRYFMLHPGETLSKTRLTEHVYDQDFDRDSNLIEVYVRRLRDKLGDEVIVTRRGQGYVFVAATPP